MSKLPAKVNYFPNDIDHREGDLFSSHLLTLHKSQPYVDYGDSCGVTVLGGESIWSSDLVIGIHLKMDTLGGPFPMSHLPGTMSTSKTFKDINL